MIYNLRSASVQRRQSEIKSVFRGGRERQGVLCCQKFRGQREGGGDKCLREPEPTF